MDLIAEQLAISRSGAAIRQLVEAGPGTGKTEVVAHRLVHLLQGENLRPANILVLCFSRTAVKALSTRLHTIGLADPSALEDLRYVAVRTFDSWTFRVLRMLGGESGTLLRRGYEENIRTLVQRLSESETVEQLRQAEMPLGPVRHLIVDELQDLCGERAELTLALARLICPPDDRRHGFTMLGDSNQAIYGFSVKNSRNRRSSVELLESLRNEWTDSLVVRSLSVNHRSGGFPAADLVTRAQAILKTPTDGLARMQSLLGGTPVVGHEALFEELGSNRRVAVLCRNNGQIATLAVELDRAANDQKRDLKGVRLGIGTPPMLLPSWIARMLGGYQGQELKRTPGQRLFEAAFPAGAKNAPASFDVAWRQLVQAAGNGREAKAFRLEDLRARLAWPDSLPDDEGQDDPPLVLTTIHQSKGLEFDSVRLMRNDWKPENADEDEEGRILFVGLSRAKQDFASLTPPTGDAYFTERKFRVDRVRWCRYLARAYWNQVEIGCDGDVDSEAMVDLQWMQTEETVRQTQVFLAEHEEELLGRRVILVKTRAPGDEVRAAYRILLQEEPGKDQCLGFTSNQLTLDLFSLMPAKLKARMKPPMAIFNLRITGVSTVARAGEALPSAAEPWKSSGFWLTPAIHGIAGFKFDWK